MRKNSVEILAGARIPQMRQNGPLVSAPPEELASLVADSAIKRSQLASADISSLYWGVMYQTEGGSVHLPRYAAARAGLPPTVPSVLVNRLCGSGLEAAIQGARAILLQETEVVLAGSTDCMTRAAKLSLQNTHPLPGLSTDKDPVAASTIDDLSGKRMAELAESFAQNAGISRSALDGFVFHSRKRAVKAQRQGFFADEVIPVKGLGLPGERTGSNEVSEDQIEMRWPTRRSLASIESPFGPKGRVTRGNSSAFADGAAAIVLASRSFANRSFANRSFAKRSNYAPLATIRSWAITAAPAADMGGAVLSAIKSALAKAEASIEQMDWIEIEEAFSANCVYAEREFALPEDRINPCGGALALGHPPATSGLRQLLCAAYGLHRTKGKLGLIALAAGGAQGMAMVIERES